MLHQFEKLTAASLLRGAATVEEVCSGTGLNKDSAMRAVYWLKEKGFVELKEEARAHYSIGEEGKRFIANGFPERNLLSRAASTPSGIAFSSLPKEELSIGLPWAKRLGWIEIASDAGGQKLVKATQKGIAEKDARYAIEDIAQKLASGSPISAEEEKAAAAAVTRGDIFVKRESSAITGLALTPLGKEKLSAEDLSVKSEVNQLTKELIVSGKWRDASIRGYDLKSPVETVYAAKAHPLQRIVGKIRNIFIEMGFEEMEGNMIESSFWTFDALFQPQDHPARELADTFYMMTPGKIAIPDEGLLDRVGKAHKQGWKYEWSREIAEQAVLRTHTTAMSARYVAEAGMGKRKTPGKFFAAGRVYRNEATDFKHLAEFQQVEGIIVDENASFTDLLGTLKEFYSKLGFKKIRFRPHYFPYTEPSLEIDVFYEPRNEWMELGGAGIFRPEVCGALWGKYPVLAWGLAIERPAMMMMGLDDIRTFYRNDIGWLRDTPAAKAELR